MIFKDLIFLSFTILIKKNPMKNQVGVIVNGVKVRGPRLGRYFDRSLR